jgi:homoserine kinase
MSAARDQVTVRVPGSTSNCGAGFDTLGLALQLYNQVTVSRSAGVTAKPAETGDARAKAMVDATAAAFFAKVKRPAFGFTYRIAGDVPAARGLGSSVTVHAGIVAGLAALAGIDFERREVVALVTALEGHPDNAAAGVFGGFCVARCNPADGAYVDTVRFEIPEELVFVVVSPEVEILTKESRGALPAMLPYFDAVKSINSATYLVAALASGDYRKLRGAVHDGMHEPYRLPRIPGGRAAIDGGVAAGAFTGWLSGSGSTVLCVAAPDSAEAVASAMKNAFQQAGVGCQARLLHADNAGLRLA